VRLLRALAALLVAAPFVVAAFLAGCTGTEPRSGAGAEAAPGERHLTLDEGKRLAAERGVPVLVDFWSPT
jgi:hypothetical protein